MQSAYDEIYQLLTDLRSEVQSILSEHFIGMYLYGSLALGNFDPLKSDVDFLIVTAGELTEEELRALQAMHLRIASGSSKWAKELECSYIPMEALRRYDPSAARHPHLDRGSGDLRVEQHDSDWVVQRYSLLNYGVRLAGPDLKPLIDPISPQELRQGVLDLIWWWEEQLKDTSRVEQSGYQAYAILSMCRILYTLEHGTIASKPVAARWAQRELGERWWGLIERALTWQPNEPMERLQETLEFIRYTIGEREIQSKKGSNYI